MSRTLFLSMICLMCFLTVSLAAQTPPTNPAANQPAPQPLWAVPAPESKGTQAEDVPTYQFYPAPADKATGASVVVCPGGGYGRLAAHEGHDIALWLNDLGVSAFVLKYRLGPRYQHPAMMWDVQRAIRTARAKAAEFKVDPNRIGVMGFSAGGHLAATAATHFDAGKPDATDPIDRVSSRPDVAILCYPVITMTLPFTHAGSRKNLLGDTPSDALVDLMSNEKQVTAQTPPTFIFHTVDDQAVPIENALMFVDALRKNKIVHETHFYEHGRHGVGLAKDDPVLSQWPKQLANWLKAHGFLTPAKVSELPAKKADRRS